MLKKIMLVSAIAALTTGVAVANPAPYVGAGLGVNVNTSNNNGFPGALFGSFRGVPFNLFAGYGGVISENFYLAGEIFGTAGTAELNNNGNLKTSYGFGASILPGLMLSDHTLAFVRAGVVNSRFSSLNTSATGGQVGFGLQTSVTQNVDLRGEYDFTAYKSMTTNTPIGSFSTSPRSDAATVSLVYKFD